MWYYIYNREDNEKHKHVSHKDSVIVQFYIFLLPYFTFLKISLINADIIHTFACARKTSADILRKCFRVLYRKCGSF